MRTIKLTISFDGTAYKGWQVQKAGKTVQGELEGTVEHVFGKKSRVHGAGRTDAGVHAISQTAHFMTTGTVPEDKIMIAMNSSLPDDIAITGAVEVPAGFHSRFDARAKHYRYYIRNSKRKDPFRERYAWAVPVKLDMDLMKREAACLEGRHDFSSFRSKDDREKDSVRNILSSRVSKKGREIRIDIEGDGFLYNMVRSIVGTLVDIGRGYLPPGSMKKILFARDRKIAGPTAPSKGLFLMEVKY